MSLRRMMHDYKDNLRLQALNLDAPGARKKAWRHFMVFDHGFLRTLWHNYAEVAPGVYRANHPSPKRLKHYADQGVRTILNLRGPSSDPHYQFEAEACAALGLTLIDLPGLTARQAPAASDLKAVLDAMKSAEKPLLIHCKSGADRTSLATALYLLAEHSADIATARKQLSPRFIHFKWTKTGILDHILDSYAKAHAATGAKVEEWLMTSYDAEKLQSEFEASRA